VVSVWQGSLGQFVRGLFEGKRRAPVVVTPPALPVLGRPMPAGDALGGAFATTMDETESLSIANTTAAV
jgi:hypothetical protein